MYLATLARRGRLDSTDSMTQHRIESATDEPTVPPILLSWLAVFRPCFSAPVWNHVLVLVGGAVLAPGKRTVTQALRVPKPASARCAPMVSSWAAISR